MFGLVCGWCAASADCRPRGACGPPCEVWGRDSRCGGNGEHHTVTNGSFYTVFIYLLVRV